jgi:hypothetical protein
MVPTETPRQGAAEGMLLLASPVGLSDWFTGSIMYFNRDVTLKNKIEG